MPSRDPIRRRRRAAHGFSLVEVALALGIVGFVLAGLIGVIPLASNVSQQSIAQGRAESIASTIFASFRAQKFSASPYLDDGTTANLNTSDQTSILTYYAYFDETITAARGNDPRRLHFVVAAPAGSSASGPVYHITLRFNNHPAGTLAPYAIGVNTTHAQANAVEASLYTLARPKDIYRFNSVIANRLE